MTDRVTALRFAGVRVAAGACIANLVFAFFSWFCVIKINDLQLLLFRVMPVAAGSRPVRRSDFGLRYGAPRRIGARASTGSSRWQR
jgi:hypothetical protein